VLLLDSSSEDDGEGEQQQQPRGSSKGRQQPRGGSKGQRPPRSRSKSTSTPAAKPAAKRAAAAKRSQPPWVDREQLWLLFQRLNGPNAAGIVSTAGIEQQQQEAGLLADQALTGRMLAVARSLAAHSGGFNVDAAAGGLDFETFVVAAQHAACL
jgi:hypothetical protein